MSTTVAITSLLGLLLVSCLAWTGFLWVGLRWAKAETVSPGRLLVAFLLSQVLVPLLLAPLALLTFGEGPAAMAVPLVRLVLLVLLTLGVFKFMFRLSVLRALQAWLPTLLTIGVTLPIAFFVLRPFLVEAFAAPTNSMAPTLLGHHFQGTCETCGGPAYCSAAAAGYSMIAAEVNHICVNFHTTSGPPLDGPVQSNDRFLVSKWIKPRRWDIIVFQYPEDPSMLYVKRLVGLPGEEITIRDGSVWADGNELTPPEPLQGLQYVSEIPNFPVPLSGTVENPAVLGEGEYFVLGDFSLNAKDSRFWERGADGHPPYAVPESHLRGVVTHIYWPPARMRILR
jgi:signal peptidase I